MLQRVIALCVVVAVAAWIWVPITLSASTVRLSIVTSGIRHHRGPGGQ